ncbi:MAG: glycosyltransferase family 4 protein [Chloroflexi bacterium]|nr:glycosyltransferase family 4 protein [Chloroflexota bacterium]
MRILLISHTYVTKENQKKLHALAAIPDVELAVVTPHLWRELILKETIAHVPTDARFTLTPIRAALPSQEQFYFYYSLDLGMRHFKPDILYVEQGAGSFVYLQSLIYRNLYTPKAKAVFFTWWNLPYRASLPLRMVERFNLNQSRGAVVGNQDAAGILRQHGYAAPLIVLPQLGIDPVEFQRKDESALRKSLGLDRFTIGFVGRLVEEKGLRVLLQALDGVSFNFQLLLVGRGPLEDEIRTYANEHGWGERLKIVSGVGHTDIARYMNCMDVFVLHSLTMPFWKEQFGHVLIEAMACETAVIGSDSAEVPNVIGEAGVVTPEKNVEALQEALTRLAASPNLRRQIGKAGRARVMTKYTHEVIARQLVEFFHTL